MPPGSCATWLLPFRRSAARQHMEAASGSVSAQCIACRPDWGLNRYGVRCAQGLTPPGYCPSAALRLGSTCTQHLAPAIRDRSSAIRDRSSAVRDRSSAVRDRSSAIRDRSSAVRDRSSAIRDPRSAIRHPPSAIGHPLFVVRHLSSARATVDESASPVGTLGCSQAA
jgi:hypothetical protein